MEDEVFLEKGTRGLVPCRTDIEVDGVVWSLDPPPPREILVLIDFYGGEGEKVFLGSSKGVFDIEQDFSLVIKNVRIEHGATYHCTVGENGTRKSYTNSTNVNVFGKLQALKFRSFFINHCNGIILKLYMIYPTFV